MSKPPELVQIRPEDFPKEQRATGNIIAATMNNFLLQITELLNQSLTFADNFNAELKTLVYKPSEQTKFKLNTVARPAGCFYYSTLIQILPERF